MKQLFFTLGNRKKIIAIAETVAQQDDRPSLNNAYSLFLNSGSTSLLQGRNKESISQLKKRNDPNYLGAIIRDNYGLFNYTAGTIPGLNDDEIQEIIEDITEVQDDTVVQKKTGT